MRGTRAGDAFGRYRLEGRIGSGGVANVFRAHDSVLERPVALKVLRPDREMHADAGGVVALGSDGSLLAGSAQS